MTRRRPSSDHALADDAANAMAALLPMHVAVTLEQLVDAACIASERVGGAPYTLLYLEQEDGRLERQLAGSELHRRSIRRAIEAFGERALPTRLDGSALAAVGDALDARQPAIMQPAGLFGDTLDESDIRSAQKSLAIGWAAIAPLEFAGEHMGLIILLSKGEPDIARLRLLADHLAAASVRVRHLGGERATAPAVRPVFDERKLHREIQRELGRAERYRRTLSIVMIEATNLRLLRERFGRALTDAQFERLGESLAEHARDFDIIGAHRQSGYAMVLVETPPDGAAAAANRLLDVAKGTVDGGGIPGLELHLTAGWASAPGDGATPEALFDVVQRRMYDDRRQTSVA